MSRKSAGGGYGIQPWRGEPAIEAGPTKSAQAIADRESQRRSGK